MKRLLPGMSVVAAMLFVASSALAGGLNLAWNNCLSEGGFANRASACTLNGGTNQLVASFIPNADITGVTGIEVVLDLIAGDGTSNLPAWWDISGVGACRAGSLVSNGTVNAANATCIDWASGAAAGGLAAYNSGGTIATANQPAHRRIVAGFAVPAASAADLVATQEYFACNVLVNNAKTVGTPNCVGCSTPVCVVLNSINVVPGTATSQFIGSGTAAGSNFATWQGVGPSCALVPTKNATWGQVKSLYH